MNELNFKIYTKSKTFRYNSLNFIFLILWFSFIISAVMNGLNPRVYIHFLLSKTHELRTKTIDPKTLLPHTIDRNALQAFADQQVAFAKLLLDSS